MRALIDNHWQSLAIIDDHGYQKNYYPFRAYEQMIVTMSTDENYVYVQKILEAAIEY